jgi:adenosylhomocysteine nucleosidase
MKVVILVLLTGIMCSGCEKSVKYSVVVSANAEWRSLKKVYPDETFSQSPWGDYFFKTVSGQKVLFFHQGWGKVAAAGATQYVIDRFNPDLLINLGTCGGFEGEAEKNEIMLAEKTVIYDIIEAMGDSKEAIADYSTSIDLSWLGDSLPLKVTRTTLVSADRDLRSEEIAFLKKEYSAVAGDWESGAIAYVAKMNNKKAVILRGVSDLVSLEKGEAYGNFSLFEQRTDSVMKGLLKDLPIWIRHIEERDGFNRRGL